MHCCAVKFAVNMENLIENGDMLSFNWVRERSFTIVESWSNKKNTNLQSSNNKSSCCVWQIHENLNYENISQMLQVHLAPSAPFHLPPNLAGVVGVDMKRA